MKISNFKCGELNGSSYVKAPLRTAFLNNKNDDNYCFLRPILAKLHPCEIKSNRVTI